MSLGSAETGSKRGTNVFQDITRQTNPLSLNAAQAGSNGEGFAVVAEEVRTAEELSKVASGLRQIVGGFNL